MNGKKRYLLSSLTISMLAVMLVGLFALSTSAGSSEATDLSLPRKPNAATPVTILELHEDQTYISQTVVVTGAYVAWDQTYLAVSYADFEANEGLSPHGYLVLEGQTPDAGFDGAIIAVTGTVGAFTYTYAYEGETEGRRVIVTDWSVLSPTLKSHAPSLSLTGLSLAPLEAEGETAAQAVDCGCKWAFILSGGVNDRSNHRRYRNDIEQKWKYKTLAADYPPECINVFYYDGDGNDLPQVPNGRVQKAEKARIEARLRELAPEMQRCKERGIKPTLQFLVTDHGSGYHDADQDTANRRGIRSSVKVDENGDEGGSGDRITESNLRLDATRLANNRMWLRNHYLGDGGQNPDTVVHNDGGTIKIWRCITPPCATPSPAHPPTDPPWKLVAQDTNGDKKITSADGGIDLNGDGDTADRVSFDEVINLVGDQVLTDDDLTDMFRPLCTSAVDLYVEMAQCYGGGFQDDLNRLRSEGCHVHFAAAAGETEVSWGNRDKDYFEYNMIAKITELISNTHKPVTPDVWKSAYDHAAAQADSTRHNTHPTSDIDCLVMFGPYVQDGQICLRLTNYCQQQITVTLYLNTFNFGLATANQGEENGSITLAAGETKEWCHPLPGTAGNYCFLGQAWILEPRSESHLRWLNDVQVETAESNEPVEQSFLVGQQAMSATVLLEPMASLPPGWEFALSQETVWLGDGPVWVTMTITPTWSTSNQGDLWVYGWLLGEGLVQSRPNLPVTVTTNLGYVYLGVTLDQYMLYLPLVVREWGP